MGSFTSLFVQALFNVTITVTNVVTKYTAPNTITTMTCRAIKCFTAADGWRAGLRVRVSTRPWRLPCLGAILIVRLVLQYPNDWLKKHLDIEDIAISITAQEAPSDSESPLVRTKALRLAVLAPVFAVLADRAVAGQTTAVVDITLEPVIATVSSQQVAWLKTFAQMMPTVLAARGVCPHRRTPCLQSHDFSDFYCWLPVLAQHASSCQWV